MSWQSSSCIKDAAPKYLFQLTVHNGAVSPVQVEESEAERSRPSSCTHIQTGSAHTVTYSTVCCYSTNQNEHKYSQVLSQSDHILLWMVVFSWYEHCSVNVFILFIELSSTLLLYVKVIADGDQRVWTQQTVTVTSQCLVSKTCHESHATNTQQFSSDRCQRGEIAEITYVPLLLCLNKC